MAHQESGAIITIGGFSFDPSTIDFSDHSSRIGAVRSTNITLIVLVAVFVFLRLSVRAILVRKIFLDDVLILVASAFTVALASVCIAATFHGLGTHVWNFPITNVLELVKSCIQYLFVCNVLYACAIASTKVAIIATYLRFVSDRKYRISMYITGGVVIGLWFTSVFVTIFQCRVVSDTWNFEITTKKCINFVNFLYASSAISMATDVVLCILPFPTLWKLRMPTKQRIIICVLFAGGAVACIASIMRLTTLGAVRSMDITYEDVESLNWSVIECSMGIICVSIPPLRPLLVRFFPKLLQTHSSSSATPRAINSAHTRRNTKQPEDTELQLKSTEMLWTYREVISSGGEDDSESKSTPSVEAAAPTP